MEFCWLSCLSPHNATMADAGSSDDEDAPPPPAAAAVGSFLAGPELLPNLLIDDSELPGQEVRPTPMRARSLLRFPSVW